MVITKTQSLALYKNILRCHRVLTEPMRSMGDQYVRTEWRLHKNVNQSLANVFYSKWNEYLHFMINQRVEGIENVVMASSDFESPHTDLVVGRDLSSDESTRMTDKQKEQLKKLKEEADTLFLKS
ncbi:hypothetical protein SAMD00019534_070060, partial [Acytostelium subglobosum LB1]|uniref:hypothetical protein n=1 Tax=Acytostelium subglobosum LB1 TaxID=1410327 RepID=UPI000644B9B8